MKDTPSIELKISVGKKPNFSIFMFASFSLEYQMKQRNRDLCVFVYSCEKWTYNLIMKAMYTNILLSICTIKGQANLNRRNREIYIS